MQCRYASSTASYSKWPVCRLVSICTRCLHLQGTEQAEGQAEEKLRGF